MQANVWSVGLGSWKHSCACITLHVWKELFEVDAEVKELKAISEKLI